MKYPSCDPSPLRITTHVASAVINGMINLKILAEYLTINEDVIYVEYKNENENIIKGNKGGKTTKKKSKGRFWNQITILFQPQKGFHNNVKIFNNGSISMTGIKKVENGKKSILMLIDKIKEIYKTQTKEILETKMEIDDLNMTDFSIALINSDYTVSYNINRNYLYRLLTNEYNIFSTFDACEYPGVNIKLFWNTNTRNTPNFGKCKCNPGSNLCNGKGSGNGKGDCKVVTIFAFQSGSIMITGARTIDQIYDAYHFINKIFEQHKSSLEMKIPDFIKKENEIKQKRKPNIFIRKDEIKKFDLYNQALKITA